MKNQLFILVILIPFLASGQTLNPQKRLSHYGLDFWSVDQGLTTNTVQKIHHASSGFMWLATRNGLLRFDGVSFKVIGNPDADILDIHETANGTLWIATNGYGLWQVNGSAVRIYRDSLTMPGGIVTVIEQNPEEGLWLGTHEGPVLFRDGMFRKITKYSSLDSYSISEIHQDEENGTWIGTRGNGLFHIREGIIRHYGSEEGLTSGMIQVLYRDHGGKTWIGTSEGLFVMDPDGIRKFPFHPPFQSIHVNNIIHDEAGTLWLGTNEGLVKVTTSRFDILDTSNGLDGQHIQVNDMTYDMEGTLWLATNMGGLVRLKDGNFVNYGPMEGLPNEIVNVAYEKNHKIWVGTEQGLGIMRADGKFYPYSLGEGNRINRVQHVLKTEEGRVFIATHQGLVVIENDEISHKYTTNDGLADDRLTTLVEGSDGSIWIGSLNGLTHFKDGTFKVYRREHGLGGNHIKALFVDQQGRLWIGTQGGGLSILNQKGFRNYRQEDGLSSDIIFQVVEDAQNRVWVCTNNGITLFDEGKFFTLNKDQGLLSDIVYQALFDWDGDIWLTTNKGLQRLDPNDIDAVVHHERPRLLIYDVFNSFDGMPTTNITSGAFGSICSNGTLLIPTIKGLTRLDPARIWTNTYKPPVVVTEVVLDQEIIPISEEVTIPKGRQPFEIHYSGLSLYSPDKVQFRYMLEGYDKDWIDVGNRRIAYYNELPPGDYTFKVKASNNDGVWNEVGSSLRIHKKAFFYQTPWFYVLVIMAALFIGFVIYQIRIRNLRRLNAELLTIVNERTHDLNQQKEAIKLQKDQLERLNHMKDKLFSIISHDLKSPINTLTSVIQLVNFEGLDASEVNAITEDIKNEVDELNQFFDNLLKWSRSQMGGIEANPSRLNIRQLIDEIIRLMEMDARKKQITVRNTLSNDLLIYSDEEMTKLIFRNLLNNAIKFTPENGSVTISGAVRGKMVEVQVTDTGIGIPEEDQKKLFTREGHYTMMGTSEEAGTGLGLLLCKEFVENNNGEIELQSEPGKGTTIQVFLPKYKHVRRDTLLQG